MPDMSDQQVLQHAYGEATKLHVRAVPLGYKVGLNMELIASRPFGQVGPLNVSYWVRRVDQLAGQEMTFTTTEAANRHLDRLATLPRYCLDLERPLVEVTPDRNGATLIADRETGQFFSMRTSDLGDATQVCVHAVSPPTDNWRPE